MPTKRAQKGDRRRCLRACETCKRRKERCDGRQPCRRCVQRGVDSDCKISHTPLAMESLFPNPESDLDGWENSPSASQERAESQHFARPFPHLSALAKDECGTYMYIGDAATLSFLNHTRRIVHTVLARSDFVDDPLRHHMEETHNGARDRLLAQGVTSPPPKPTLQDADYLVHWYMLATNCLLNIIDQHELMRNMSDWCRRPRGEPSDANAINYLILALGAQSCPENREETAEDYFNYGRYITLTIFMEDPSLVTIQCHVLITMYLLTGSRRNAAFMYLGTAVRAAYALGLHKLEVSALYPPAEYSTRERLWRAIRILDLFLSASLGRPPSTTETRDTTAKENYSASNDLCVIFEKILTEIYAKHRVSSEALTRIIHLHRGWTSRFTECLKTGAIQNSEQLETERGMIPNIGLIQLKEAYYWTIMLLTQPLLIEKVSLYVSATTPSGTGMASSSSNNVLATACVDSAIRTIDLLSSFVRGENVPKRLPLIVNSAFLSALVLGVAVFGDMDHTLPLRRSLEDARMVLRKFSSHDTVTKNHLIIVDSLKNACDKYVEIRTRHNMDRQGRLIGGLFGSLDVDLSALHSCHHEDTSACQPDQEQESLNENGSPNKLSSFTGIDNDHQLQDDISYLNLPIPQDYTCIDANGSPNNAILPLSPQALLFDSYDVGWLLASTVDANV